LEVLLGDAAPLLLELLQPAAATITAAALAAISHRLFISYHPAFLGHRLFG
jgi:hypothetical protein